MPEVDLVTIKHAAAILDCSTMTVRRRMNEGALGPVVKRGRKFLRLYRANVESFAKAVEEIRTPTSSSANPEQVSERSAARRTCDACGIVWSPTDIVTPNTCPECGGELA